MWAQAFKCMLRVAEAVGDDLQERCGRQEVGGRLGWEGQHAFKSTLKVAEAMGNNLQEGWRGQAAAVPCCRLQRLWEITCRRGEGGWAGSGEQAGRGR